MGLSGVQRSLKFAKYLKKYNWEPTILTTGNTAYFAHDQSLMEDVKAADLRIERVVGSDINSLLAKKGTMPMPREIIRKAFSDISKLLFIPDNKKGWASKAYLRAKELLQNEKYDLIYVTIPPFSSFAMAAKLKKEFDLPLFVDYRDLWVGNQFALMPTPYHKMKHKKLEYFSLKAADKVIAVNRKVKENLLTNYPFLNFDDITIITHGFDPEDFAKVKPLPKTSNKLIIAYSGIFYEKISPKYLLKAFKQVLIERPDIGENIELHFIGYFRKENQKLVKKLGLQQHVKVFGYLEHSDALAHMMTADVLWLMLPNTVNIDKVTVGKLFEYFGTRKPIFGNLPEGASRTAAKEYGASFLTDPENIEEIKNAIYHIHQLYKANNLPVPDEEFIDKHDRSKLTQVLAKEFQFYLKEE